LRRIILALVVLTILVAAALPATAQNRGNNDWDDNDKWDDNNKWDDNDRHNNDWNNNNVWCNWYPSWRGWDYWCYSGQVLKFL